MMPLGESVSELSIMIQDEVARRLADKTPGRADYRAMNLKVQFYSRVRYRFSIPKEKYYPAPTVDGALITFDLLPRERRVAVPSERGLLSLVAAAFSSRRKMMRNAVPPLFTTEQVEGALTAEGLRPDARAQDLNFDQFVRVYRRLHASVVKDLVGDGADTGSTDAGSTQS
mmetsp:Transcript_19915/g.43357  ORF Transcript_19915/g.43357 Transcript_19915/m.43357 type:complete len:171 (-) Transcript_19915:69-581(-)